MGTTPVLFSGGMPVTSDEAAAALGVTRSTIAKWVNNGHMTVAKTLASGARLFTVEEVERVRAAHWPHKRGGYRKRERSTAA
jgi:excisionase family DNA binding protein